MVVMVAAPLTPNNAAPTFGIHRITNVAFHFRKELNFCFPADGIITVDLGFTADAFFVDVDRTANSSGAIIRRRDPADRTIVHLKTCFQDLTSFIVDAGRPRNGPIGIERLGPNDLTVRTESDQHRWSGRPPLFLDGSQMARSIRSVSTGPWTFHWAR